MSSIKAHSPLQQQLAPFYLTTQLLPILEKSQPSRVVNVASMAHYLIYFHGLTLDILNDKSKYNADRAYSRSKTCNILFTRELAQRLKAKGVEVCLFDVYCGDFKHYLTLQIMLHDITDCLCQLQSSRSRQNRTYQAY